MGAVLNVLFGNNGSRAQLFDVAGIQLLNEHILFKFGGDHSHLERQLLFLGDLTDDLHFPGHMDIRTAAAGCADDQGDVQLAGSLQHQSHITLDRGGIGEGNAAAQIVRAGVGRAAVAGDQIGLLGHACQERCLREAVTDDTAGG